METEEWRPVDGWPYEISNHGRVRRAGAACGTSPGLVLKCQVNAQGYIWVGLRRRGQRQKTHFVHGLVAAAFLGRRPKGRQVNHKNGIKSDNRPENLEWVTHPENQRHAYENGLQGRGSAHGRAKLREEQVREIRRLYLTTRTSQQALANLFGVSQALVAQIINRRIWTHID